MWGHREGLAAEVPHGRGGSPKPGNILRRSVLISHGGIGHTGQGPYSQGKYCGDDRPPTGVMPGPKVLGSHPRDVTPL